MQRVKVCVLLDVNDKYQDPEAIAAQVVRQCASSMTQSKYWFYRGSYVMKEPTLKEQLNEETVKARAAHVMHNIRAAELAVKKCREACIDEARKGCNTLDYECTKNEASAIADELRDIYQSTYEDDEGQTHVKLAW